MGVDPRLGPRGGDRERHQLHAGDALGREHQGPAGRHRGLAGLHPGLLEQFPPRAGLEIDLAVENVAGVRRSGGKIDLSGVEGMRGHLADQESPVGPAQRRHREAIVDRFAGIAEFFPGEVIGIVGLEKDASERQHAIGSRLDRAPAQKQHPPVEQRGLRLPQSRPVRRDARRLTFGERPARGLEREVELADLEEARRLAQRSSEPLERMTTEPPIVAAPSAPASIVRPSTIRLGRPISKPCSIVSVCSPSPGRSKA